MNITPLEWHVKSSIHANSAGPLTRAAIEQYQGKQVCRVLDFCRDHSPWYRRRLAAAGIGRISGLSDLATLPLTSEEDLRSHGPDMLCVNQDAVARIITLPSSGTTGPPKRLFFTEKDLEHTLDFFHQGMQSLVDPGQEVAILLPGTTPDSTGHLLAQALERMAVSSRIIGLVEDPLPTALQLAQIKPDVLVGFPVQILAVARTAAAHALKLGPIRSVLLCSDYIPMSLSTRLADLLSCEVFSHYGTVETGLGGGVDCDAHNGCHLRESDLFFEIIDPATTAPMADGEWGEIVCTTLSRTGMPLLRYRTGDYSRLLPGVCACGSHIRRMDRIMGRINQRRTLTNGHKLAMPDLDELLFPIPGLLDFRATLTTKAQQDHLTLDLVTLPGTEEGALSLATAAMTQHPLCHDIPFSLTLHPNPRIHRGKRILEDKREENPL